MSHIQPDTESVFLVSGGAKGITAQCVIEMARRYGCRFVLVGRSPYPAEPEPEWSRDVDDEGALKGRAARHLTSTGEKPTPRRVGRMVKGVLSRREIAATLSTVEETGGTAVYASADVTDADGLRAAVAEALGRLRSPGDPVAITGIVHGAGAIADKPIERKTEADFDLVYGVKIEGLKNLLACADPQTLRHLILFSSVAGFYGNLGQADYAMANEVLNKAAHLIRRRHPEWNVRAIDWGPWDGGMVTPALKRLLARRNVALIPAQVGAAICTNAVGHGAGDAVQTVVGAPLPVPARTPGETLRTYRVHRRLTLEANLFLRHHVIGGHAVLPTVCAVGWAVNACEQLYPGYTFFRVEDYRVFKGIVFDETLADDYVLELSERSKGPEEITFEARVSSQTPEGRDRFHYGMRVVLRRDPPEAPRYPEFDLEERQPVAGATLYEDGTLFHGPYFQGVDRILNSGEDGLALRCRLPQMGEEAQGQFPVQTFNPYLTDAQLQSLLVWSARYHGCGGLPLRIEGGEQFRTVAFEETTYASMRVRSASRTRLVADLFVHDGEGRLYSRVTGAEITLSERLKTLFRQNRLRGQP